MEQARYDSSTEELSPEELRMLTSKRQEPQGEEYAAIPGKFCATAAVKMESSDDETTSTSSYSSGGEEECGAQFPSNSGPTISRISKSKKHSRQHHNYHKSNNLSTDSSNSHSAYNTLIIHQNNSSLLADTWIPASHEFTSYGIGHHRGGDEQRERDESRAQSHPPHSFSNPYENSTPLTSSELSEIPRDYLNQLTVLKHLAKEVKQDPISGTTGSSLLRSGSFSKSQPDLTQVAGYIRSSTAGDGNGEVNRAKSQPQPGHSRKGKKHSPIGVANETVQYEVQQPTPDEEQSQGDDVLPSVQIFEILMRENSTLNAELVNARRKVGTIHKLESELNRLQASHEALFASAERRESLERTARAKLSTELKRLTAFNRELLSSGSLQNLSPSPFVPVPVPDSLSADLLKKELSKRDITIAQLIAQNKELTAIRERQEIELSAQRATLADQRAHIDILDNALTNSQASVLRLEEECRKKQEFVDKSTQLQRALSSLQLTNDKREQTEKKARNQMEAEITDLKIRLATFNCVSSKQSQLPGRIPPSSQQSTTGRNYQTPPYTPPKYESNSNLNENPIPLLQEKIKLSEEQIQQLNSQVAKWEQVFSPQNLSGNGYKQQTSQGPSTSAPNTPNSWTNSNSRGGTPHFFGSSGASGEKVSLEELTHTSSQSRGNELEWKVKDLESRLLEKDAVIRILQTSPSPIYSPAMYNTNSISIPGGNGSGGILYAPPSSLPSYRDSPTYSQACTIGLQSSCASHPISVSMAAMDPTLYSKGYLVNPSPGPEPPSYANLPLKLRLGGSGSSLVKNSTESLQLGSTSGGSTGGSSPIISSLASTPGPTNKSIDDQLKEIQSQLLSKDDGVGIGGSSAIAGTLKMQSGLCCIPGFAHSGSSTRKGKISQSLLESLTIPGGTQQPRKLSPTSSAVLPPKPPSGLPLSYVQGQGPRTTSGPPFVSPNDSPAILSPLVTTTTAMSVDSILHEPSQGKEEGQAREDSGTNIFSPAIGIPKGLPPRPTGTDSSVVGKSRSLERNKSNIPGDNCAGKYTPVMYDGTRCRSLDRRDLKLSLQQDTITGSGKIMSAEDKKSTESGAKNFKSSVSSKAAFFGQLLTRRSPSPGREKKEGSGSTPKLGRRFPFGMKAQSSPPPPDRKESSSSISTDPLGNSSNEERILLNKQGRQSQRNRISSKWNSCNTLEAVEEQSGSESPWIGRKGGKKGTESSPKVSKKLGTSSPSSNSSSSNQQQIEDSNRKWGRIVRTPFGLRYSFGSPRVATPMGPSGGSANSSTSNPKS